jgi:porphobilinogen deaminase
VLHTAENIMVLSKKALVRFGIGEYHPNRADTREMVGIVGQGIFGVTIDEGNNMLKVSPTPFDCRITNKRL